MKVNKKILLYVLWLGCIFGGIYGFVKSTYSVSVDYYDRIHFISNGDAFVTFLNSDSADGVEKGPSPSETILLESQGKFALIDAGLANDGDSLNPNRANYVIDYLKEIGVKELEFVLITHVHYDHMGGANQIITNIPTKKLYVKSYYANDASTGTTKENNVKRWEKLYETASSQGIYQKINANFENKQLDLGNMSLFLYNTRNLQYYKACYGEDENINSIMTYITVNNKKIFLTGDIEKVENKNGNCSGVYGATCDEDTLMCANDGCTGGSITKCIVDKYNIKDLDLFKLPHHGYGSCDVDGILNPVSIVAGNWEEKIVYYYSGLTLSNGLKVGPVYNSSSCRAKYFSSYNVNDSEKKLYYVGDNNLIFDFTDGNMDIYTMTINETDSSVSFSDDVIVNKDRKQLSFLIKNLNVNNILEKINTEATVLVVDKDDNVKETTDLIKTGDKVQIYVSDELIEQYILVVKGDVTGDGVISLTDLQDIAKHFLGSKKIDKDEFISAGDMNSDNKISINDIIKLSKYMSNNS